MNKKELKIKKENYDLIITEKNSEVSIVKTNLRFLIELQSYSRIPEEEKDKLNLDEQQQIRFELTKYEFPKKIYEIFIHSVIIEKEDIPKIIEFLNISQGK